MKDLKVKLHDAEPVFIYLKKKKKKSCTAFCHTCPHSTIPLHHNADSVRRHSAAQGWRRTEACM